MTALLRRSTHKVRRMRCERNRTARHFASGRRRQRGNRVRTVSTSLLARHASFTIKRFPQWGSRWISPGGGKVVSADYSATHPSQSVLFAPPTPRPNYWFFFFAFPVPLSHQSKGLETWRDAESKEVQTGSRSAAGWGGKRGRGVKASPPAPPRPRMRTGAGPLWVGCPSPVSANLSEKGGDDGSSRPESPARRRAAAPRSGDGCRSKRPAVLGPYPFFPRACRM